MTVARHYRLEAAPGRQDEVLGSLEALAAALGGIAGFEGADLLRDLNEPGRFVFIEKWSSPEAYEAGKASVPKPALQQLMQVLASPPESAFLSYAAIGAPAARV